MTMFEIMQEIEGSNGWTYDVQTLGKGSQALGRHRMTLSFADYNLWSVDGSVRPSTVAEAVVSFLLSRMSAEDLPERLDASFARRRFADADTEIPRRIRR